MNLPKPNVRYGDGSITVRGENVVQARWREDGKLRAKTFRADTLEHAQDEAEDYLRKRARERRDGNYRPPSDLTVADLIDEALARMATRLSTRTVRTYRQRADQMIVPRLGKRKAVALETLEIQRWVDRLTKDGYKASTVHAALSVLYNALREAKVLGVIPRNPAEGVRRPGIVRTSVQTWTLPEVRRVLAASRKDPIYGVLYYVALFTGMRPGELRALQWRDIDFDRGIITVQRTITRDANGSEILGGQTKTHKIRAVAFSDDLATELRRQQETQAARRLKAGPDWTERDLVFDRGDGHWIYQSSWQRYHIALCQQAGVPQIRAHDLRHTSASLELEAGTHPKIVADRLGHSSIEITLDLYSHVSADLQRAAADALSKRLYVGDDHDNTAAE